MPASPTHERKEMAKVFSRVRKQGDVVSGDIDGAVAPPRVVPESEQLTPEETIEKKLLVELLLKWVPPAKISKTSQPEDDWKLFSRKVSGQTLMELRRFFDVDMPEIAVYAIRNKWKDLSP